jgi:hypothetical protein
MDSGGKGRAAAASLLEISRLLENVAEQVRRHAFDAETDAPAPPESGPETDPRWVRAILDVRALRRQFLGFETSDGALAMMLELYVARLEGRSIHQTALGVAARVPPTTALRAARMFLARGIVTRHPDSVDKRLHLLALSDAAAMRLRAYLATAAHLAPLLV